MGKLQRSLTKCCTIQRLHMQELELMQTAANSFMIAASQVEAPEAVTVTIEPEGLGEPMRRAAASRDCAAATSSSSSSTQWPTNRRRFRPHGTAAAAMAWSAEAARKAAAEGNLARGVELSEDEPLSEIVRPAQQQPEPRAPMHQQPAAKRRRTIKLVPRLIEPEADCRRNGRSSVCLAC